MCMVLVATLARVCSRLRACARGHVGEDSRSNDGVTRRHQAEDGANVQGGLALECPRGAMLEMMDFVEYRSLNFRRSIRAWVSGEIGIQVLHLLSVAPAQDGCGALRQKGSRAGEPTPHTLRIRHDCVGACPVTLVPVIKAMARHGVPRAGRRKDVLLAEESFKIGSRSCTCVT
jgi:hypothetical protein